MRNILFILVTIVLSKIYVFASSPYQVFNIDNNESKRIDFASIKSDRTGIRTFEILNNTSDVSSVEIDSIYDDRYFQVSLSPSCSAVDFNNTCIVKVDFNPFTNEEKYYEDNLTLDISDGARRNTLSVLLTGILDNNAFDSNLANFVDGYFNKYRTGDESLKLINQGKGDLYIYETYMSISEAITINDGCLNKLLKENEYCEITVTHHEYDVTSYDNLNILSDDTTTPKMIIEIEAYNESAFAGCFIATAAYGSYFEPNVKILKDFRDSVLLRSELGTLFVQTYYRLSPPLADYIAGSESLRSITRILLTPFVYLVKYSLLTSFLFFFLLVTIYKRKRIIYRLKKHYV